MGWFDGFFLETKVTSVKTVTDTELPMSPGVKAKLGNVIESSVTRTEQTQFRKSIADRVVDPESGIAYYPTPIIKVDEQIDVKNITYGQVSKNLRYPLVLTLKGQREYAVLSQKETLKFTGTIGAKIDNLFLGGFSEISTVKDVDGVKWKNGAQIQVNDKKGNSFRLRFGK